MGAGYGPGEKPPAGQRVEPGHGEHPQRERAGLRGRGRRGDQGHRRGQPGPGQLCAHPADPGTAGEQDGHPALYAGAQLVQHRADEQPAGRPPDYGDDRHPESADAGGGEDLPAVAENARVQLRRGGGVG